MGGRWSRAVHVQCQPYWYCLNAQSLAPAMSMPIYTIGAPACLCAQVQLNAGWIAKFTERCACELDLSEPSQRQGFWHRREFNRPKLNIRVLLSASFYGPQTYEVILQLVHLVALTLSCKSRPCLACRDRPVASSAACHPRRSRSSFLSC